MKFSLFGRNFQFAETPDLKKEIGGSGTSNYQGFINNEEYNNELSEVQGIKTYDEMRRSDATVGASLKVLDMPIRGTEWFVEPASEDEEDEKIADFVEKNLMDLQEVTWDNFLRQALLMLPYGVMVFEKVYQDVEWEGQEKIGLKKLAYRAPDSIQRWQTDDGELGIKQLRTNGESVSIPMDKLLVFVLNKEGENYWGRSVLRQAYKPWYLKQRVEKIDAIGLEKQGLGVPIIYPPNGASDEDREKAKEWAKNLRASENAFAVMPGPKDEWTVEFLDMGAEGTREPDTFIRRQDRQILLNVLAQFLQLGSESSSGSWALSRDQSSLLMESLQAIADNVKDTINRSFVKELVDLNFDIENYPKLQYGELGAIDWKEMSTAIKNLTAGGVLVPDEKLEKRVRKIMKLPEKDESETPNDREKEETQKKEEAKMDEPKKKEFKEGNYWRPLTFAERKINLGKIEKYYDRHEQEFIDMASEHFSKVSDTFFERLSNYAESFGERDKIKDLSLPYKNEYAKKINEELKDAYNFGKVQAANEMDIAPPPNKQADLKRLRLQADIIANKHYQDLEYESKQAIVTAHQKGVAVSEAIKEAKDKFNDKAKQLAGDTASITGGAGVNQGRRGVFDRNADDIYALQRSEILDRKTCSFCVSVDGRIVDKKDPFAQNDIWHSDCRGIWAEILKDEAEKPDIKGVPNFLQDRFDGTVNGLIQPRQPIPKANSLASRFVK